MDAGLIAPAVVAAALVIRTAVAELRVLGSARAAWAFTAIPPRRPRPPPSSAWSR
ncbi:hypothetical protein ACN6LM_006572 [Streptomyces sp. SAS_281]|uniref:hypothetical protein n=1 Tax=Streptomyces sp. SAS_281 TaxID=3412744 RepID=UPI00403C9A8D